jgi:hypothetical protein
VGTNPDWATFDEALAFVKLISAPFGQLSEAQWHHLTETSVMQRSDGRWVFRYDPLITAPFKAAFADKDVDLWPMYEQIKCSTLAIRGALRLADTRYLAKDGFLRSASKIGRNWGRACADVPVGRSDRHRPRFLLSA